MSVHVSSWVWDHSPHKGSKLLMLLALADQCNDEGVCWPKVNTIAKRMRITASRVRTMLRELKDSGDIAVVINKGTKTSSGWTNRYYINGYRIAKEMKAVESTETEPLTDEEKAEISEKVKAAKASPDENNNPQDLLEVTPPVENNSASSVESNSASPVENNRDNRHGNHHVNHHYMGADAPNGKTPPIHVVDKPEPKGRPQGQAREEYIYALQNSWQVTNKTAAMLFSHIWGTTKDQARIDNPIEKPLTEEQVIDFPKWWKQAYPKAHMPKAPDKLPDAIVKYHAANRKITTLTPVDVVSDIAPTPAAEMFDPFATADEQKESA